MLIGHLNHVQHFVSDENDVVIPKSVRPIIDYEETQLGDRKGATRQFRLGNLHIREYNEYYTAHMDKIDPNKDALGHLLFDAPQYLVAILAAISVGTCVGSIIHNNNNNKNIVKKIGFQPRSGIIAGCIAGSTAGAISYLMGNIVKGIIKRIECTKSL
jgi:hypothetical protein